MCRSLIPPRTLKGFRDFLPETMIPREQLIDTARQVYRSYGYLPIATPALEHEEILLGKGGVETDKQLYRFADHGGRSVGLRFDLTVPLARFTAQHLARLGLPFKAYHIAPVWRGENTQRGRYREFMQCDFDTIGTRSPVADIETALVIHDLLHAIGFDRFTIHVNNRMLLTGLLERLGLAERAVAILRALDKLAKIGRDRVADEMIETAGLARHDTEKVLQLVETTGTNQQILTEVGRLVRGSAGGEAGVERLAELLASLQATGVPEGRIRLDVAIARGLDYYTGVVFETTLDQLPAIGSVCSGGRYDDLAGLYTHEQLPGVGASLGLDRLLTAMQELGMIDQVHPLAPVLIAYFDPHRLQDYLQIASSLRAAGIAVEVYPDPKRLGHQLKYANRRGFRVALIAGQDELAASTCQVKNLQTGTSNSVSLADGTEQLVTEIHRILDGP
ncbi:MAG: histidine--tRNA ligase [Planctomycetes bacterium RBG_16_64_10]|nr:MAG: histidine--tRNA ligase [Planctomycetes bacterium RBG_16_64_10]